MTKALRAACVWWQREMKTEEQTSPWGERGVGGMGVSLSEGVGVAGQVCLFQGEHVCNVVLGSIGWDVADAAAFKALQATRACNVHGCAVKLGDAMIREIAQTNTGGRRQARRVRGHARSEGGSVGDGGNLAPM